jgi:hypothetical protein
MSLPLLFFFFFFFFSRRCGVGMHGRVSTLAYAVFFCFVVLSPCAKMLMAIKAPKKGTSRGVLLLLLRVRGSENKRPGYNAAVRYRSIDKEIISLEEKLISLKKIWEFFYPFSYFWRFGFDPSRNRHTTNGWWEIQLSSVLVAFLTGRVIMALVNK